LELVVPSVPNVAIDTAGVFSTSPPPAPSRTAIGARRCRSAPQGRQPCDQPRFAWRHRVRAGRGTIETCASCTRPVRSISSRSVRAGCARPGRRCRRDRLRSARHDPKANCQGRDQRESRQGCRGRKLQGETSGSASCSMYFSSYWRGPARRKARKGNRNGGLAVVGGCPFSPGGPRRIRAWMSGRRKRSRRRPPQVDRGLGRTRSDQDLARLPTRASGRSKGKPAPLSPARRRSIFPRIDAGHLVQRLPPVPSPGRPSSLVAIRVWNRIGMIPRSYVPLTPGSGLTAWSVRLVSG
jgi:hypothetical protein